MSVVKYLGHFITDDLTDDQDIARQNSILFCQGQGNTILWKFHIAAWSLSWHCFVPTVLQFIVLICSGISEKGSLT